MHIDFVSQAEKVSESWNEILHSVVIKGCFQKVPISGS